MSANEVAVGCHIEVALYDINTRVGCGAQGGNAVLNGTLCAVVSTVCDYLLC